MDIETLSKRTRAMAERLVIEEKLSDMVGKRYEIFRRTGLPPGCYLGRTSASSRISDERRAEWHKLLESFGMRIGCTALQDCYNVRYPAPQSHTPTIVNVPKDATLKILVLGSLP